MPNTLYADGLKIPAPTLASGQFYSNVSIPAPTLASGTNDARLTVPKPTLASQMLGAAVQVSAPAPTMSATATASAAMNASLVMPAPSMSAAGIAGGILTVVTSTPAPVLVATLNNPAIITATPMVPAPRLVATLLPGNIATASLKAVAPIMAAAGFPAFLISAGLRAPAPQLVALLTSVLPSTYATWVLNTRKGALTEYGPEFAFNSYAVFNGQVLAVGPNGVVLLDAQALDDAAPIDATVRTGADNFGSAYLKRVPRVYIEYETDGDAYFRTITGEGGKRTYLVGWNRGVNLQQRRVPIGKGPKSANWQFEYENIAGADFGLKSVLVYPVNLRRRVQ